MKTTTQYILGLSYKLDGIDFEKGDLFRIILNDLRGYIKQEHTINGIALSNKAKMSQFKDNLIKELDKTVITEATTKKMNNLVSNVISWYKLNVGFNVDDLTYSTINSILKVIRQDKLINQFKKDLLEIKSEYNEGGFDELTLNDILQDTCNKYLIKTVKYDELHKTVIKVKSGKLSIEDLTSLLSRV